MELALNKDLAIAHAALTEAADEITAAADLTMQLILAGMGINSDCGAAITEGASGVHDRLSATLDRLREARDGLRPPQHASTVPPDEM